MATEVQTEGESKKVEQQEPAKAPPPAAQAKEPPKAEAATPAKVKAAEESTKTAPARHALKDDEDVPDTAELLEMSAKALNGRLARHTKKQLRDHFGTDDIAEIKAKIDRLQELESKEEERRRADLSEKEKLAEDLKKSNARADAAEQRHQAAISRQEIVESDVRIKEIAREHIDMGDYDYVSTKFAQYLVAECSDKDMGKMTDKVIDKWFQDFAKEKPKFAKATAASADVAPPAKVMLDNGASPKRPDAAAVSGQAGAKTAKPGQPNSMTKKEISDMGYRW
jgi:hypothetical protein